MLYFSIYSLIIATTGVVSLQLPGLTGRFSVGTVILELVDTSRIDPFAPSRQPRDLMVSVFYPTSEAALRIGNYSFAPYFSSPKTASAFNIYLSNSTEILQIVMQSYDQAPITKTNFPMLIFSHGLGSSRFMYRAQLEDLASQGWIIVAPDHPTMR
jgi:predicted dienelactone hydrolase